MRKMHVKLTTIEGMLGTVPANPKIYEEFIGSHAPDAATLQDEIDALGVDAVADKGMTVFRRLEDGTPFLYDYQIKGFFKDACGALSRLKGKDKTAKNESAKLSAYKKIIDGLIFVQPRKISIRFEGSMGECQRPLRAQTMQGERVSLAKSEEIPAGATMEFDILYFDESHLPAIEEWLAYGALRGIGQWRNSGKGRFLYEIL